MNVTRKRCACLVLAWAAVDVLSVSLWTPSALADDPAPPTKGPEVSTVGTAPYAGPLPEELAKLAQVTASPAESTPVEKEPAASTITTSGGITLTAGELAKLAALLAVPLTPPSAVMVKPEPMEVSKDGHSELTAQEIEKHARELETQNSSSPSPMVPQFGPSGMIGTTGPTNAVKVEPTTPSAPTAPRTAPGSGR